MPKSKIHHRKYQIGKTTIPAITELLPVPSLRFGDDARRLGKNFHLFVQFIDDVKAGKRPVIFGEDYVVMSRKHYNKLIKSNKRKKL